MRVKPVWTLREIADVRARAATQTQREVAAHYGVTLGALKALCHRQSISFRQAKRVAA